MKKNYIFLSTMALALVITFVTITAVHANKYTRPSYSQTAADTASSEEAKSLSDCMTYSANHVSKGVRADKNMFKRQYGEPIAASGSTYEYSYDRYTKILLDCVGGRCNCRCMQKY